VAKNTTSNTAGAKGATVRWLEAPVKHDYPAAGSYLRLLADPAVIEAVTQALEKAPDRGPAREGRAARCRAAVAPPG